MTGFKKYKHLERFGNTEVDGIEYGKCYIFPKIDGTNASIWHKKRSVRAGSRSRELSLEKDNAGFLKWVRDQNNIKDFFDKYRDKTLYGEWLVPHTLKTYRDDAWRNFYVFDVYCNSGGGYLRYETYIDMLDEFNIQYIMPISIIKNPTMENFKNAIAHNKYLLNDNSGVGEGIVVKNYDFKNKHNNMEYAKIVRQEFKERNQKVFGPQVIDAKKSVEEIIVGKYVTGTLIEKEYAKIVNECDGWSSKLIPRLLQTVFYCLVKEECWEFVKENKMPVIDFKRLNGLTVAKIKEVKSELF